MIKPTDFLQFVISPVLHHLSQTDPLLGSRSAENLLLGTALMESNLKHFRQIGGGAVSFFQIEEATFRDIYHRYLNKRRDLIGPIDALRMPAFGLMDQLVWNQHFACAIARLKYFMVPASLPAADNIDAMGHYWKDHYNTAQGKGTAAQWALKYRRYI